MGMKEVYINISECTELLLKKSVSTEFVDTILNKIEKEVIYEIAELPTFPNWNENDVKSAIGKILKEKLGNE